MDDFQAVREMRTEPPPVLPPYGGMPLELPTSKYNRSGSSELFSFHMKTVVITTDDSIVSKRYTTES